MSLGSDGIPRYESDNCTLAEKLYRHIPEAITAVNNYITKVAERSVLNIYWIANPVVSRNPYSSQLLERVLRKIALREKIAFRLGIGRLSVKLCKYFARNLAYLGLIPVYFLTYRLSRLSRKSVGILKEKHIFLVDTFTMIDRIYPAKGLKDTYFSGLYEALRGNSEQYRILCTLFGDHPLNLIRRLKTYNFLSNDEHLYLTEFDIFRVTDIFRLIYHTIIYPFAAIRLLWKNFDPNYDDIFHEEVINTLDKVQAHHFMRYLCARRLGRISDVGCTVLSWYENQSRDMLFARGMKESGTARIVGCQFFYAISTWLHHEPLDWQIVARAAPDEIWVSGSYYLSKRSSIPYRVGMLPRSDYLLREAIRHEEIGGRREILVLLTYDVDESKHILKLARSALTGRAEIVRIKLHPNHLLNDPGFEIPAAWVKESVPLSELCPNAWLVLSGGTSAAVDAVCMNCSVVIVGAEDGITHNPMPNLGEGVLWKLAFNPNQAISAMRQLQTIRQTEDAKVRGCSQTFRESLVSPSSVQKFNELLGRNATWSSDEVNLLANQKNYSS